MMNAYVQCALSVPRNSKSNLPAAVINVISLVLKITPSSPDATPMIWLYGIETMIFFEKNTLVIEDHALVSDADKTRSAPLAIPDRMQRLAWNNVGHYSFVLALLIVFCVWHDVTYDTALNVRQLNCLPNFIRELRKRFNARSAF